MRLEFVVVIGIVLIMHSIYVAGSSASQKGDSDLLEEFWGMSLFLPLFTVASSIPTFIVVALLYWWLY